MSIVEEIGDTSSSTRHDEALHNLLAQHADIPEAFLQTVFGFLQRNSDFFQQANSQRKVLQALQKATGMATPSSQGVKSGFFGKSGTKSKASPSTSARATDLASEPAASKVESGTYSAAHRTIESSPSQAAQSESTDAAAEPAAGSAVSGGYSTAVRDVPQDASDTSGKQNGASASGAAPMDVTGSRDAANNRTKEDSDDDSKDSKGLKPNAGNGYDHDQYSWTQTLGDLSVNVPVPSGTKGRGCEVSITRSHLSVGLKGEKPILSGDLAMDVKADDCMWNLSDGRLIEVTLAKVDTMRWWPSVLKDEPAINLQKVEPENSKISDLDGDTRATVEKMMYDQRQKQMGLPTSEQQSKNAMLQKFMAAHPEMDFSNAKIS